MTSKPPEPAASGSSSPLAPSITMCHLETDASLNNKRFKTLDDGSVLPFAGGGVVLRRISMRHIARAPVPLGFVRTTNEAECRALIAGLRLARGHGARTVFARSDNLPLVEFANGREGFKRPEMVELGEQLEEEAAAPNRPGRKGKNSSVTQGIGRPVPPPAAPSRWSNHPHRPVPTPSVCSGCREPRGTECSESFWPQCSARLPWCSPGGDRRRAAP